ncbi:MAG: threonine synthase [Firmicutes bacterium]|nr:threonine synthase [Bacillota bacterium]MDH7496027.1 threonine synthase [Bacillota bacterium]
MRHLECTSCCGVVEERGGALTCPSCGTEGILDVVYDYDVIAGAMDRMGRHSGRDARRARLRRDCFAATGESSMWRYLPFLPVDPAWEKPPLRVGWTPLYDAKRLARALGARSLFVKDEGVNPTGSLKDRASAIAAVRAKAAGRRVVACASTGNAASSLAGCAASMGLRSSIFVPRRAPRGKLMQLLLYGATVVSVDGSYGDTFSLSAVAIERWGWYNRNAAINPYLVEGKKTVSFEICEQLGWRAPDWVVVSVGDGCTVAGVYKGFHDFHRTGLITHIPRILGVQAAGCRPLVEAFKSGADSVRPWPEDTVADSIAVGVPRNPAKALKAVRLSGGDMIAVPDDEILRAMRLLGSTTGVFSEPAGAASLAGLCAGLESRIIGREETVVIIATGNGLKDIVNAERAAPPPIEVGTGIEELGPILEARARDLLVQGE